MNIDVYVSKLNTVLIDPCITINSGVKNGYKACFKFQQQWNEKLVLYAVFKPVNDVPISILLDENNCCTIPPQIYKRFAKLGIGVKGVLKQGEEIIQQESTNLRYIPINNSGY